MFFEAVFARALSWSRFQPALATPMTGHVEVAALDHRLQRREDLLVGQVAGGTEKNQRIGMGRVHGVVLTFAGFSRWPPNSKRIAESSLSW